MSPFTWYSLELKQSMKRMKLDTGHISRCRLIVSLITSFHNWGFDTLSSALLILSIYGLAVIQLKSYLFLYA